MRFVLLLVWLCQQISWAKSVFRSPSALTFPSGSNKRFFRFFKVNSHFLLLIFRIFFLSSTSYYERFFSFPFRLMILFLVEFSSRDLLIVFVDLICVDVFSWRFVSCCYYDSNRVNECLSRKRNVLCSSIWFRGEKEKQNTKATKTRYRRPWKFFFFLVSCPKITKITAQRSFFLVSFHVKLFQITILISFAARNFLPHIKSLFLSFLLSINNFTA